VVEIAWKEDFSSGGDNRLTRRPVRVSAHCSQTSWPIPSMALVQPSAHNIPGRPVIQCRHKSYRTSAIHPSCPSKSSDDDLAGLCHVGSYLDSHAELRRNHSCFAIAASPRPRSPGNSGYVPSVAKRRSWTLTKNQVHELDIWGVVLRQAETL